MDEGGTHSQRRLRIPDRAMAPGCTAVDSSRQRRHAKILHWQPEAISLRRRSRRAGRCKVRLNVRRFLCHPYRGFRCRQSDPNGSCDSRRGRRSSARRTVTL